MEQWKKINDFDYMISNKGRVKNILTGHISIGSPNKDKYIKVDLYKNKKRTRFGMHRLVAEYFLPAPTQELLEWAATTKLNKVHVNHLDCDRSNNDVSNLEWTTAPDNVKYSYTHGAATKQRGRRKLSDEQIDIIKFEYSKYNGTIIEYAKEVCAKYNVVSKTIRRILYNETWKD